MPIDAGTSPFHYDHPIIARYTSPTVLCPRTGCKKKISRLQLIVDAIGTIDKCPFWGKPWHAAKPSPTAWLSWRHPTSRTLTALTHFSRFFFQFEILTQSDLTCLDIFTVRITLLHSCPPHHPFGNYHPRPACLREILLAVFCSTRDIGHRPATDRPPGSGETAPDTRVVPGCAMMS